MRHHLKKAHSIVLLDNIDQDEENIDNDDDYTTQPKSNKESLVVSLILKFIIQAFLPFRIVENKAFLEIFRILDPKFQVPSKWMFSNRILNEKFDFIVEKITRDLSFADSVGLTLDAWTSCQPYPYLGNFLVNNSYF